MVYVDCVIPVDLSFLSFCIVLILLAFASFNTKACKTGLDKNIIDDHHVSLIQTFLRVFYKHINLRKHLLVLLPPLSKPFYKN